MIMNLSVLASFLWAILLTSSAQAAALNKQEILQVQSCSEPELQPLGVHQQVVVRLKYITCDTQNNPTFNSKENELELSQLNQDSNTVALVKALCQVLESQLRAQAIDIENSYCMKE
ncbi:hypothetical protein [Bdellovibrio svalbardensis]|uniref:Uncharacterized protein n=1 Tax=Bdellovibrio svalbardensis TaxID=2972972 RepID=A0ABT6DM01_9BACT|nr:hypothetical protein [Bdellovibrio svalbardensis]MDG0817629.1 hypothetical protein [Bdellovibrio svalbardensis]